MLSVLLLFLVPFGVFIPAGVLLSKTYGIGWPTMTFLYFVSDVILAFLFEPMLKVFAAAGRRYPFLERVGAAFRKSMDKTAAYYGSSTAGPITLILISFGIDPMTGRTAAAAAGHGFVSGWAIAIAGDMMSFVVVAAATLKISTMLGSPDRALAIVMGVMLVAPFLFRRLKKALARGNPAP
jgi:hypothetical protein